MKQLLRLLVYFLVIQMFWMAGCATESLQRSEAPRDMKIDSILVIPFQVIDTGGNRDTISCPISGVVCQPGPIEGDTNFLYQKLYNYIKNQTDYNVVSQRGSEDVRQHLLQKDLGISQRGLVVEMGKALRADAVLAGTLYRFKQRVGSAFSAETTASVGFGIHLIRVADGRLVWSRQFDETQRSLSEDLFKLGTFMKRGGGWLTAEELASYGLDAVMTHFPPR